MRGFLAKVAVWPGGTLPPPAQVALLQAAMFAGPPPHLLAHPPTFLCLLCSCQGPGPLVAHMQVYGREGGTELRATLSFEEAESLEQVLPLCCWTESFAHSQIKAKGAAEPENRLLAAETCVHTDSNSHFWLMLT